MFSIIDNYIVYTYIQIASDRHCTEFSKAILKRTNEISKYIGVLLTYRFSRSREQIVFVVNSSRSKSTVHTDEQLIEDLCPHISWEREIRILMRGTRFISSRIRSSTYNNITGLRVGIYGDVFRSDYTKFGMLEQPSGKLRPYPEMSHKSVDVTANLPPEIVFKFNIFVRIKRGQLYFWQVHV